jgi:hypothetical protein
VGFVASGYPEGEVVRCRATEATQQQHVCQAAAAQAPYARVSEQGGIKVCTQWQPLPEATVAGTCHERLDLVITAASGSVAVTHARNGSTTGGQGEEATSMLHLVGLG